MRQITLTAVLAKIPPSGQDFSKICQYHPTRWFLIWALPFLFLSSVARSEIFSETFYRTIETSDGLPDNNVTGIAQAADGYLWVATEGGLMRSNGTSLTEIPLQRIDGVKSRFISALEFDRRSLAWVGMQRGLLIRIGRNGNRNFSESDGMPAGAPLSFAEDREGAMWVAYEKGIARILKEEVTAFTEADGLPAGENVSLASDGLGRPWFAKGGKLGVFTDGIPKVRKVFDTEKLCIGKASEGGLWICSESGIFFRSDKVDVERRGLLPEGVIAKALFEDATGWLWIGTAKSGLFKMRDGIVEAVPVSNPEVTCIKADHEGNIWVGTRGGGLNLIRPRSITVINHSSGLPSGPAVSVCEDDQGNLWSVSGSGVLSRSDGKEWSPVAEVGGKVTCVSANPQGSVLVGTAGDGVFGYSDGEWEKWSLGDEAFDKHVRGILATTGGEIWVVTESPQEVFRVRQGKWAVAKELENAGKITAMSEGVGDVVWLGTSDAKIFSVSSDSLSAVLEKEEAPPLSIRALHSTPDGSLWIGYAGDGLGWLKNGKYARITEADGLMDDYISQLVSDSGGGLWVASNRGLYEVRINDLLAVAEEKSKWVRSRVYGASEGLPGLQPSHEAFPSSCLTGDGRLLFAMRNGLVLAHPERIHDNRKPPTVLLERVSLDDKLVAMYGNRTAIGEGVLDLSNPASVLQVPPDYAKLNFDFAALSFVSPENVKFRYKLDGFDSDWIEADTRHSATYPRLPAGKYVFHVIACNNAGVWNLEGNSLSLRVSPFFWETGWFRLGVGSMALLFAGGVVFVLQRYRHRKQLQAIAESRAVEGERARIARDIHDDLGSNLTRIMLLSESSGGKEKMGSVISQIHDAAQHLVRAIGEVVWAVNPQQDTLEGLADYLSSYAQSFLGLAGIRCRLEMPLHLSAYKLTAEVRHGLFLASKEALNNVVKHSEASEVRISLQPGISDFILRIEDNGKGMGELREQGNGLGNLNTRLREIGGICRVMNAPESGTIVEFEIHLKKHP